MSNSPTLNDDSELREKLRKFQYNDSQAIALSDDHIDHIQQIIHQRDEARDSKTKDSILFNIYLLIDHRVKADGTNAISAIKLRRSIENYQKQLATPKKTNNN